MTVAPKEKLTLNALDSFFAQHASAILSVKCESDEVSGKGAHAMKKVQKKAHDKLSSA
ncbi:hypothetical protein [Vibrio cholerae]|uniref:hypothetical protein n=1 Tax=Vibrio cholerae TaxID=666 RepID=UPI002AB5B311|nr:hypothetical protein [Vibrio cholerae]MDY7586663.1 hypothetical protein [Vibrio cholerae]